MDDLRLTHATIVPMTSEKVCLRDSTLYMSENRIMAIAKAGDTLSEYSGEVIDLEGKLVTPPFLNAHHHLYQTGITKPHSHSDLVSWLTNVLFKEEPLLDKRVVYKNALNDIKGFLKSGIGYLILQESNLFYDTVIQAVESCKIKSLVGRYCGDNTETLPDSLSESPRESLRELSHYRHKYRKNTYIKVSLSPRFLPAVTPEFLDYLKNHISEFGPFLQIHFNESRGEINLTKHIHHKDPALVLNDYGLLNGSTILPHSIYLTDEEFAILSQKKPTLTTSPTTNLSLSGAVAPVATYLASGIPVGLGLDSFATSKSQTYHQELHALAGIAKLPRETLIPRILLSSANIAYRIFGGGIIKRGSSADLAVFSVKPHNPWDYISNHLMPEDLEFMLLNGGTAYGEVQH